MKARAHAYMLLCVCIPCSLVPTYTHWSLHTCICQRVSSSCIYIYTCTCIHTEHAYKIPSTNVCRRTYTYSYIYILIHVHTHTYTYIYIYSSTQPLRYSNCNKFNSCSNKARGCLWSILVDRFVCMYFVCKYIRICTYQCTCKM